LAAAVHRDSDPLDRANYRAMLERLGGESDTVTVERFSNWAVGWVDYILVAPTDWARLRIVYRARKGLEDYPILDGDIFSEVEDADCAETWSGCYSPRERLDYIRNHGHSDRPGFLPLLRAVRGDWWEAANILHCPSDLIY
jgi:hypothetical protein